MTEPGIPSPPGMPSSAGIPALPARPARPRVDIPNPFGRGGPASGEHYDAVRPSYPDAAVEWVLEGVVPSPLDVVEVGAGTGLFTRLLAARVPARVRSVAAVEPSEPMRAVLVRELAGPRTSVDPVVDPVRAAAPPVCAVAGTGEATGLLEASADVVVAAQAWHWMDVPAASAEAARVLRPGGRLAAVWNQLDTSVPWVHRLTRIMHAGDVHAQRPEQRRFADPFGVEEHARWTWSLTTTPAALHGLMASRSYWLRADERIRARLTANLDWYLHEHLGHAVEAEIALPYLTVAWRAAAPGAPTC